MKIKRLALGAITVCLTIVVVAQFTTDAITCLRWQAKALAINNILGGPTEAWWIESPLRVALGLLMNNTDALLQILGAVLSGLAQGMVKK